MKIDDIAKQLANKVNQEHYIKHYLEKVQRGAYNKGVKDTEAKQLPINGVVTGLLCVDDANCDYITLGDTYKLIEESETLYTILDNDGDEIKYDKNNFTKIYK